jgi:hypothetical protein
MSLYNFLVPNAASSLLVTASSHFSFNIMSLVTQLVYS